MTVEQKIRQLLETIFDEGVVNAMSVFKGYAVDSGSNGWHYNKFGESRNVYMGKSLAEVESWLKEEKEMRTMRW